MNVIVSNKYQTLLSNLEIDIIKSINGVFSVEELVAQFSNFYYNKMIIDITAIRNYENIGTIQTLSVNFDMSKLIILLDDSETVNSPIYLSQLVSMGVYNFTWDVNSINFLLTNPNSYKDVASYQNLSGFTPSKLNDKSKDSTNNTKGKINQRVIGFKNITEHAGSTTLVYLLKKHLERYYSVKAVEVEGNDFVYFNDKELDYTSSFDLSNYISKNDSVDVILVDLNSDSDSLCDEVIYLIEPGLVKLNKLIRKNNKIFEELKDKKIVLNRSVLNDKDVQDFESESGSKIFYNLPSLDDKYDDQSIVYSFLSALGFSRIDQDSGKGIFKIFK